MRKPNGFLDFSQLSPRRCSVLFLPVWTAAFFFSLAFLATAEPARAFGFEDVAGQAKALVAKPYKAPVAHLPRDLARISVDEYAQVLYRPQRAVWLADGLPFTLRFLPLGGMRTRPVAIHEVQGDSVRQFSFDPADYDYGSRSSATAWKSLGRNGLAGLQVLYPLNQPKYMDEVISFLGASYFRALGAGQWYGLSARGLGIDTVGAPQEEFPRFVSFWVVRPAHDADTITIYALLDSPSATGAYRFDVRPGRETVVDVHVRLYLRKAVATLELAPLTSMFLQGPSQPLPGDDRPAAHDSSGLMLALGRPQGGTEWVWRPLGNPPHPFTTSFATSTLQGFGLMQRNRDFAHYQDTDYHYEKRPSCWIMPIGNWGAGRIQLYEWTTPNDDLDNIDAFWVPDHQPAPGQPLDFAYRMHWQGDRQQRPDQLGWVHQTRLGHRPPSGPPENVWHQDRTVTQYTVDFDGPALRRLPAAFDAPGEVTAVVSGNANAKILSSKVSRISPDGAWRLTLRFRRLQASQPVERRAALHHHNEILSETWAMVIPPQ